MLVRQRPDVAADAVGRQAVAVDDGGGHADERGEQREPVVEVDVEAREDLEGEALQDEEAGDDAERVGEGDEGAGLVADGAVAGRFCEVFGDCCC